MKKSRLLIALLASACMMFGCKAKESPSPAAASSSSVSEVVPSSSEIPSTSEEEVVSHTAESVTAAFNAALAGEGYSFAAEYDEEHGEYALAVNFGESSDESEESLSGAASALASFLPEYMSNTAAVYGDPTAEGYHDLFGDSSYYFFAGFESEDSAVVAEVISYVYNGLLIAQIGIYDAE